jgi:hypothetical protein
MKKLIALCCLLLLTSCAGEEKVEVAPEVDTLVKPQTPVATGEGIEIDSNSGVLIDRSRMRSPEHLSTMERFEPTAVVSIYTEFRPLRKPGLRQQSLDSFLNYHKISYRELQAILSEGDQLGWNRVDTNLPTPH